MTTISDGELGSSVRAKLNATGLLKNNLSASAAPTVGDDTGDGYEVGSLWIDTTNDQAYVALDVSSGAAVWQNLGSGGFSQEEIEDFVGAMVGGASTQTGITVSYDDANGELDFVVDTETDPVVGAVSGIVKADGAGNISAAVANTDYQTVLSEGAFANGDKTKLDGIATGADVSPTTEEIQDLVGAMVSGNTETGITVTYQDTDGTIDFVVSDLTVAGDTGSTGMTPGDTLTIAGGTNVTTSITGDTLTINATAGSGGDVDGGSASTAGDTIQVRGDTAANWTSNDPTLAAREIGYETDTGFFKVGDGSTAWTSLGYTLSGLGDPGADRGTGWDDSAGAMAYWTAGTGLSFDGSFNLNVGGLTVSEIDAGSLTGSDTDFVTGTAGTNGNLLQWDANGDAVDSSIAAANVVVDSDIADMVVSDPTGVTGADAITNIMSLTTAEYGAITPNASTLYIITDA